MLVAVTANESKASQSRGFFISTPSQDHPHHAEENMACHRVDSSGGL